MLCLPACEQAPVRFYKPDEETYFTQICRRMRGAGFWCRVLVVLFTGLCILLLKSLSGVLLCGWLSIDCLCIFLCSGSQGFLFEGQLTVGAEPPPPQWLQSQNLFTSLFRDQVQQMAEREAAVAANGQGIHLYIPIGNMNPRSLLTLVLFWC